MEICKYYIFNTTWEPFPIVLLIRIEMFEP